MRILIDAKNLALYKGGISYWLSHKLKQWFEVVKKDQEFTILYPAGPNLNLIQFDEVDHQTLAWPFFLPRKLRHIWYDNISFPMAVKKIRPQFIFSPYHDVRLPKKSAQIFSVITVHDLCFLDAPKAYPWFIRVYYLWMLRLNLSRASHVITISEATRNRLKNAFGITAKKISIIPNAIDPDFLRSIPSPADQQGWRRQFNDADAKIVLYSSGIEHRKNIARLLAAFRQLWLQGHKLFLCITGNVDPRWQYLFTQEEIQSGKIRFLGYLSQADLRLAYQSVDLVVYPSLCEGFGRACIESMVCGTPLACSDLPVFHEVASNYATYFDPLNIDSIAKSIANSLEVGRKVPFQDMRYQIGYVQEEFIRVMSDLLLNAKSVEGAHQ